MVTEGFECCWGWSYGLDGCKAVRGGSRAFYGVLCSRVHWGMFPNLLEFYLSHVPVDSPMNCCGNQKNL